MTEQSWHCAEEQRLADRHFNVSRGTRALSEQAEGSCGQRPYEMRSSRDPVKLSFGGRRHCGDGDASRGSKTMRDSLAMYALRLTAAASCAVRSQGTDASTRYEAQQRGRP